ncbi:MAG: CBS domain-containing protein [Candidatus Bathyarchaeota archaeon]|nr:CBS domain-containing protein [Candidatus Bathyarchaeota archaeon]
MMLTGSHLRRLRKDAGLTQKQLAQLVGVSQAHIAKIENLKVDPRLSTVNRILKVLTEGTGRKCSDIMTRNVVFAKPGDKILDVSRIMIKKAISQLPVIQGSKVVGTITEEAIIRNLHINIAEKTVEGIIDTPLPGIPENTTVNVIRPLLEEHSGVLVMRKSEVIGIITRSDLLKILSKAI